MHMSMCKCLYVFIISYLELIYRGTYGNLQGHSCMDIYIRSKSVTLFPVNEEYPLCALQKQAFKVMLLLL